MSAVEKFKPENLWQTPASVPYKNLLWTQFLHKDRFDLFIYCRYKKCFGFAEFGFARTTLLFRQYASISFIVIFFLLWNVKCTHKYC